MVNRGGVIRSKAGNGLTEYFSPKEILRTGETTCQGCVAPRKRLALDTAAEYPRIERRRKRLNAYAVDCFLFWLQK